MIDKVGSNLKFTRQDRQSIGEDLSMLLDSLEMGGHFGPLENKGETKE